MFTKLKLLLDKKMGNNKSGVILVGGQAEVGLKSANQLHHAVLGGTISE